MAELLKNIYNPAFFERILPVMRDSLPLFDERRFVYEIFDPHWPDLELKQRVQKIASSLRAVLPDDFPAAASLLSALSAHFRTKRICVQGFELIFIPEFIGMYGSVYMTESLNALREITRLASGEFAIRTFLKISPDRTMDELLTWASDPDENVRRLASEGCRPRLPWGAGVPWLKKNPARILSVLDILKTDPSAYVRRSVANNLNDIAKDHPELARETARQWKGTHPFTDEIIRHGCRSLLKKGDPDSLMLHGIDPGSKMDVTSLELSGKRIQIGGELRFDLQLRNREKKTTPFRLDYAIDYCTSSGRKSTRVFRIGDKSLESDENLQITRKQSFKDLTTRKHFPGIHTIHVIVNGRRKISRDFLVV